MIQRIQSVYLALAAFLSLFMLNGGQLRFADGSGRTVNLMHSGSLSGNGVETVETLIILWPYWLAVVLTALVSIVTIFLFKKRHIQIRLAKLLVVLSVLLAALCIAYIIYLNNNFGMKVVPGAGLFIPLPIILFAVLALKGITRDDRLVKSYDRLR